MENWVNELVIVRMRRHSIIDDAEDLELLYRAVGLRVELA